MFDRPTLALCISYAIFPDLAVYAFVSYVSYIQARPVDVLGWLVVLFVLFGCLYIVGMHLQVEIERIRRDESLDGQPRQAYRNEPRAIPNMNTVVNENSTPLVEIDVMGIKVKRCCRTLINQRENGFKIDLREETWTGQFGNRDNFVYFRDVIMGKAFAKGPNKNSTFFVVNWEEVQRGAEGRL